MTQGNRPKIIVGNWKMYKTIPETVEFIQALIPLVPNPACKIYLAVPFTAIREASVAAEGSNIVIGAQNMSDASEGAFTGEIAAAMLKDAGAKFVILGHSERRKIFKETNDFINKKVKKAIEEGLQPLLCVGETKQERDTNQSQVILEQQMTQCLADLTAEEVKTVIIAYEPVWAIGSDLAASSELVEKEHQYLRQFFFQKWGQTSAEALEILYGGSVKVANAKQFLQLSDVDGLLIGGASLSVETFSKIINYQNLQLA